VHDNVRLRFTCITTIIEVMFDKNFLTDTMRGALPAESKSKGTTGTKPAVPRSASQPGNHKKQAVICQSYWVLSGVFVYFHSSFDAWQ